MSGRHMVNYNGHVYERLDFIRIFGMYGNWSEFGEVIIEKFKTVVLDRRSEKVKSMLFEHYKNDPDSPFKDEPEKLVEFLDAHFGLLSSHDGMLPHVMNILEDPK